MHFQWELMNIRWTANSFKVSLMETLLVEGSGYAIMAKTGDSVVTPRQNIKKNYEIERASVMPFFLGTNYKLWNMPWTDIQTYMLLCILRASCVQTQDNGTVTFHLCGESWSHRYNQVWPWHQAGGRTGGGRPTAVYGVPWKLGPRVWR